MNCNTTHYRANSSSVPGDPTESDLRVLPEPPRFGPADRQRESPARAAALDHGLPLWPWLIALALLVLLIEPLVASPSAPKST